VPKEYSRTQRVGEQIHRELAALISQELKNPGIGMITLGDVEVSRDLAHARIYFTVLGDESACKASESALQKSRHFLRRELGKRMRIRVVPELRFVFDDTQVRGERLDALIAEAIKKDQKQSEED